MNKKNTYTTLCMTATANNAGYDEGTTHKYAIEDVEKVLYAPNGHKLPYEEEYPLHCQIHFKDKTSRCFRAQDWVITFK